ncbi:lysophospholipid acyltransferase family protein [Thermodesulfobacteriota bacterium]
MIKLKFKSFLYRYILPYAGLLLVKLISWTNRFRFVDLKNETDALSREESVVYASWHQRFFPGITIFAKRKPIAIMISQSRDGEFVARIADLFGWHSVRGSSSRGGARALVTVRRLAGSGYKIGHIVDGPRGPFGVVKPGLLRIAQVSGKPIVPVITSAQKKWVFNSWDRFMVPKPFSRVVIRFGEAVYVPPDLDKETFEQKRVFVEKRFKALYQDTDRIWENPQQIKEIFKRDKLRKKGA